MTKFLSEYWFVIVIIAALIAVGFYLIYCFCKMPRSAQLNKVKEWLLWAVTEAEKELGAGTGEVKLRYVYDMFLSKFPQLARFVTFDSFSNMVDQVLDNFRDMLTSNEKLNNYVKGGE